MSLRMVGEGEEKSKIILTKFYRAVTMAKIVPAITSLTYLIPNGASYIDLARDLSRINRRLYRQGRNYAVESITITTAVGMKQSDIIAQVWYSMGNSYVVHNAWEKAFKAWRKQVKDHEITPGTTGRWNDFKIYLDDTMEDGTTLDLYAGDGAALSSTYDWNYSKLAFDDDGTEREFTMCMIGSPNLADTNEESGIALIEAYQDSRITPSTAPHLQAEYSDSIYAKLLGTDELTDMILDNIEGDNDDPPYDPDSYYGGQSNGDAAHVERITAVSAAEVVRTVPGFIAPCGLIKVSSEEMSLDTNGFLADAQAANGVYQSGSAPTVIAIVRLVPGPYKGVLAPPMGQ